MTREQTPKEMTVIDSETRLEVTRQVAFRTIGEQVVLVSPEDNHMLTLNPSASVAWNGLDGERTVGDLSELLAREFDVTLEQAQQDVLLFLQEMLDRGLLAVVGDGR